MPGLSRRATLIGGLSVLGAGVTGAGAFSLVEAGALPGKFRLARVLGQCGSDPGIPRAPMGPVTTQTFMSRYRRREVEMITIAPPGRFASLPVTVVLHGAGGRARSALVLGIPGFLGQAVTRGGVPPFAMVCVDGGPSTYWHRRSGGDDPLGMIINEVLPRLARRRRSGETAYQTGSIGIFGWSMGGLGALLLAARLTQAGPPGVAAVVASSPAVFASYPAAHLANRAAFDGPADFAANDPSHDTALLSRLHLMIDCGTGDPFAPQDALLRRRLGNPAGAMRPGCHDASFWRRRLPAQLAFLGGHLHTPGRSG